ncbi:LysR family transcriptional regulator [Lentibacter sp.]|uniref:LysR family transcriptional regulator n=1 Tax=Lentibacter sp. TaxID=2024994 RepID=UPI003F6B695F
MDSLGHLKQLVALSETGNFRKAGQKLGISHSAVSQTIKRLETEYGAELFDRTRYDGSRNETVPTALGERVISAARIAINEMEAASRDVQMMRDLEAGQLLIGADPTVSESLLAPAMARLINSHPNWRFKVVLCPRNEWERYLTERQIDIYIGLRPDRETEEFRYRQLELIPPAIMCSASHPLAGKGPIRIEELQQYSVIGGDVPDWFLWGIMEAYPDTFPDIGTLRDTFLTSQGLGLLRQLLLLTNAIATLPEFIVRSEVNEGSVIKLDVINWPYANRTIPGVAVWLNQRPIPPAAHQLMSNVQMVLQRAVANFRRDIEQ